MFDLYELYEQPCNPEFRVQLEKAHAYYSRIEQAFSPEFLDGFWQAHMTLTELERDNSYREGFLAGAAFATRAFLSTPGVIIP